MHLKICTMAVALFLVAATGASANESSHYYFTKGSRCVAGPSDKVAFVMYADAFDKTKVQNFVLRARMIPHGQDTPLQNFARPWTTVTSPSFIVAGTAGHRYTMTAAAPVPDLQKDWDLQVKMTWNRLGRIDWNTSLTIRFEEDACPVIGVG
jgi:hypothetical protein